MGSLLQNESHFQMHGFARRLVLTQMQFKSQLENGLFFWQVEREAKNLYIARGGMQRKASDDHNDGKEN